MLHKSKFLWTTSSSQTWNHQRNKWNQVRCRRKEGVMGLTALRIFLASNDKYEVWSVSHCPTVIPTGLSVQHPQDPDIDGILAEGFTCKGSSEELDTVSLWPFWGQRKHYYWILGQAHPGQYFSEKLIKAQVSLIFHMITTKIRPLWVFFSPIYSIFIYCEMLETPANIR